MIEITREDKEKWEKKRKKRKSKETNNQKPYGYHSPENYATNRDFENYFLGALIAGIANKINNQ